MTTFGHPLQDLERIDATLRTRYWSWTYFDASDAPQSLLEVLTTNLPHLDPASWPERFDFGGIYINGHLMLQDSPLPFPCRVEYYEPKFAIGEALSIFPEFDSSFVVYEDGDIAVVYKPPKLSSLPAKEQRHFSLKNSLDRHFGCAVHMPSRLDVSVQGLVAVSINRETHAPLQKLFEDRRVEKSYRLITDRPIEWQEREINAPIGRDPRHPVLRTVVPHGGQSATTIFHKLAQTKAHTLLSASPITGRTHQIRVHAAHAGAPILGDNFYGGTPHAELSLVSFAVSFPHPRHGRRVSVELPDRLKPVWASPNTYVTEYAE